MAFGLRDAAIALHDRFRGYLPLTRKSHSKEATTRFDPLARTKADFVAEIIKRDETLALRERDLEGLGHQLSATKSQLRAQDETHTQELENAQRVAASREEVLATELKELASENTRLREAAGASESAIGRLKVEIAQLKGDARHRSTVIEKLKEERLERAKLAAQEREALVRAERSVEELRENTNLGERNECTRTRAADDGLSD